MSFLPWIADAVPVICREAHITRAFSIPPEYNKPCYDVVINLAAETRQGQPEALYASRCTQLATFCAQKAVDVGVPRFIQVQRLCDVSRYEEDIDADHRFVVIQRCLLMY